MTAKSGCQAFYVMCVIIFMVDFCLSIQKRSYFVFWCFILVGQNMNRHNHVSDIAGRRSFKDEHGGMMERGGDSG